MYKGLLLLISMFILPNCGVMSARVTKTEPALAPYMEEIEAYYGVDYQGSLEFSEFEGNKVGECSTGVDLIGEYRIIKISQRYFTKATEQQRWSLMLHEFGHCQFMAEHTIEVMGDLCPVSIMHPHVLTPVCYARYVDYYWEELNTRR